MIWKEFSIVFVKLLKFLKVTNKGFIIKVHREKWILKWKNFSNFISKKDCFFLNNLGKIFKYIFKIAKLFN